MIDFSQDQLGILTRGTVNPGDIYRMRLTDKEGVKPKNSGDTSRNKYFVVVGTTTDGSIIGVVLINTEINRNISQSLKDSHYRIKAEDYPFLGKDRYLCCGELKSIASSVFFSRFREGVVGTLKEEHLEVVKALLISSDNVSAALLRRFGLL